MNTLNRCVVCKRLLENDAEGLTCDRQSCERAYKSKSSLNERYQQFREFFADKTPTEENYYDFFILTNLEKDYQNFLTPGNSTKRRMWYMLNIASVHNEWKDEFGRRYHGELNNE